MKHLSHNEMVSKEAVYGISALRRRFQHFNDNHTGLCVLSVVLLKYVNDYLECRRRHYERVHKNDMDVINRKMKRERFVLPPDTDFTSLHKKINAYPLNAGTLLNQITSSIELANEEMLGGLLRSVDFNNATHVGTSIADWPKFLVNLVDVVGKMTLASEITDQAVDAELLLEYIWSRWLNQTNSSAAEQHYAPANLGRLVIKLLNPKSGCRIYDPSCKAGSLLIEAAAAVTDDENNPSGNFALYGQEAQAAATYLARIRLLIRELDGAQISLSDPIRNPLKAENGELIKFDIVLSNLPWNIQNWGYEEAKNDVFKRFKWGLVPEMKGDWAYIQHMISTTSSEGRIGVIIPTGLLFREGKERLIRQAIVENNILDAVIMLPVNLFFYTKLACAIIILDKNRGEKKNILFVDASKEFEVDKRQNRLREIDIEHIYSTYDNFKNTGSTTSTEISNSTVVSPEDVSNHNFSFYVPMYIPTNTDNKESINCMELELKIVELRKSLEEVRIGIKNNFQLLGI
ncbi:MULTISPECIES: N-6 DNA methylase [Niastella]|uniref:site-specific DNA-methyltransferase (adenine-specific) n=1 Tax=Niastella soli TaxID=2821487 RepID=A0ABS3Z3V6_9BACT|nr:N-6 DNA methylase [Niastella soli]MBO9204848.1 N-6 DNA methylase [Niastella soli]